MKQAFHLGIKVHFTDLTSTDRGNQILYGVKFASDPSESETTAATLLSPHLRYFHVFSPEKEFDV